MVPRWSALALLLLPFAPAAGSEAWGESPMEFALESDAECLEGQEGCVFSALQLRGRTVDAAAGSGEPAEEGAAGDDVNNGGHPEGPPLIADADPAWDEPAATSASAALDGSLHAADVTCAMSPFTQRCGIYATCMGQPYCVLGGYLVAPGAPVPGMESINGGNAHSFDYLFNVARGYCQSTTCVLLTNPVHHRTQDQLHIHFRQQTGGGAAMQAQLEKATCNAPGWVNFNAGCCGCASGKARAYDYMPGVFSEVAAAYGGGSLASVGISVWLTTACGVKTIVLATTHCSIEHTVSDR